MLKFLSRTFAVIVLAAYAATSFSHGLVVAEVQRILPAQLQQEIPEVKLTSHQVDDAVVSVRVYQRVPYFGYDRPSRLKFLPIEDITARINVGSGTAFFISSDGYLLTNKHVVVDANAEYTVELGEDNEIPATVVYRDPYEDLAVLKVEGYNYPKIELGDSSRLRIGQRITGIGNAYGEVTDSKSEGIISAVNRNVYVSDAQGDTERLQGLIQISAPLYPGDSGGPLLNTQNQVIGVNVASAIGQNIGFSIPINVAKDTLERAGLNM